jgi:hypothetical protein
MRSLAYLLTVAGTIIVLALATIVFTILVDPYRMFATPTVRGLTELKPRAAEQMGIAKTYQLERTAPQTLLLGNSRTEIGLDPNSPQFPAEQRPVFNASYPGRDVCTSLLMLRDAMAVRIPQRVILGVDFQDMLAIGVSWPSDLEQRLLVSESGRRNPPRERQVWKDRFAATLTIGALLDSMTTLLNQNAVSSATITELGFNPLHEYREFIARGGYYGLFSAKNALYHKQYAAFPMPNFSRPSPGMARRNRCFVELAKSALEHHIPLTVYIHPYHADFLDMLDYFGLWESFEDWKRHLVGQVADLDPDGTDIRVIDFSGYNQFTTEAVPGRGDTKSEMRWYWEPGHYKSALGEHILERIIRGRGQFGRDLTPATVDTALAEIRDERKRFVRLSGAGAAWADRVGAQPPASTRPVSTINR